jgi:hypothetical protein
VVGVHRLNRALPTAGPATLRGFAGYYWRGKEPTDIPKHVIELQIDAWITSDAATDRLSPAEAIDAALTDPSFADYLQTQTLSNGRAEIAWYDADRDLWEIGVMPWYETKPPADPWGPRRRRHKAASSGRWTVRGTRMSTRSLSRGIGGPSRWGAPRYSR